MTNFDDLFLEDEGENNSFAEIRKAMEDPGIVQAIDEAKIRAALKNTEALPTDESPFIDKNTLELDAIVAHLIGSSVRVNGKLVVKFNDGNDDIQLIGSDMHAEFQGFVADTDSGKLEYRYCFKVQVVNTEDGTLRALTYDEVENNSNQDETLEWLAEGCPENVHLTFDNIHPIQALAWLSLTYPDVLNQVDACVLSIDSENAGKQLLGLKDFKIVLPDNMPRSELDMLLKSLRQYVCGLISLDKEVSYAVIVDGKYEKFADEDNEDFETKSLTHASRPFSLLNLITKSVPTGDLFESIETSQEYSFVLHGILHQLDTDLPSEQVIMPLTSLEDIFLLRDLFASTLATGETA